MAHSYYHTLLLSTLPWITILWVLKIMGAKFSYIVLLIFGGIGALIYQCHIYPVYATPFRFLPTPKSRSYWLGNHAKPVKLIGQELPQLCNEFLGEQIIRYYTFFSVEMIIVLGPEAISELCFKQHDSFSHSKTIELLAEAGLGYSGLLAARGRKHKYLRKLFSPVFTPGTVAKISTSLWEDCQELVRDIGQQTLSLNISQWSSRSILELSGTCVFGQESAWLCRYPCLLGSLDRRVANGQVKKAVLSIFPRLVRSLLMLTLYNRKDLADLGYLEYVARDLLQIEKRKLVKPIKPNYTVNLISVMLKDGSLTDEEMLGHILIFLAGASETTSATFQWMILELCRHTAVQTNLRDEIQSRRHLLSRSDGGKSLFLQIEAFPYLRAVVDEVLRLHPAVALTEHEATRDTTIMNVPIPKGTLLLCPPLAANLNRRIWGKDATVFNPERWLSRGPASQKPANQNHCSNMTFSHGPRSCPGRSIARQMLTCLTAAFICQYQISLENPEQPFASTEAVYAKPIPELMVRLIKIT